MYFYDCSSVGDCFGMPKSSLHSAFVRVVQSLNKIAPKVIKWPSGDRIDEIENGFYEIELMNNILGVIGNCQIPIKQAQRSKEKSIKLQAVCDDKLKFTNCYCSETNDEVNDSEFFRKSTIYNDIMSDREKYLPDSKILIAEDTYPLLNWCITPYSPDAYPEQEQNNFNACFSRTWNTIRRTFALLKGRFLRLKYLEMNKADMIPRTVIAACVLHNICIETGDELLNEYLAEGEAILSVEQPLTFTVWDNTDEDKEAAALRDKMAKELMESYKLF